MITGFSHVQLVVHDVAISAAWYCEVLGLERFVEGSIASGPYVGLRHQGAGFVVGLQTSTPEQQALGGAGRVDHLSFAVVDEPSLQVARTGLLARGFDVGEIFDEGASYNVRLRDPDGLVVELTARKRRVPG